MAGPADAGRLSELVSDMSAGSVDTLVIVDANPAYTAPGSLGFREALSHVQTSLHLGRSATRPANSASGSFR